MPTSTLVVILSNNVALMPPSAGLLKIGLPVEGSAVTVGQFWLLEDQLGITQLLRRRKGARKLFIRLYVAISAYFRVLAKVNNFRLNFVEND